MNKDKHPGSFVRSELKNRKLSITAAANQIGVTRQALSNLLNGKCSLSSEMSARLSSTFGIDCSGFLETQAKQEQEFHLKEVSTTPFIPSLSTIKAYEIESWSDRVQSRHSLSVLLRRLVYSTGGRFSKLVFPGYDNAERKGWDGEVVTETSTPWVPIGLSGWEFGCNKRPKSKADKDYQARVDSVPGRERQERTFIFVTPRNWPGKESWIKAKQAEKIWKDVRAYDASDLEQWIEKAATVQIWFAEQLGKPSRGYRSLEGCWRSWSQATEPPLPQDLFEVAVGLHRETITEWLQQPISKPLTISANSPGEAVAFLYSAFSHEALKKYKDCVVKVETLEALQRLELTSPGALTLLTTDLEIQRELSWFLSRFHCILFLPQNFASQEADIRLETPGHSEFKEALISLDFSNEERAQLARKSACSPTILRRILAISPALRVPLWASRSDHARSLVPFALIGVWHKASQGDREVLKLVADAKSYDSIESVLAELGTLDETPVWRTGPYRGVYSKSDTFFAIASQITETDLKRFFLAAEYVLSERDPALDLPAETRAFAGLYGKLREHSRAIRKSLCETLTLLSLHGEDLLWESTGVNVCREVEALVGRILSPFTTEHLLSHDYDLPLYAEAAPSVFLSFLENDLNKQNPETFGLLRSADVSILGGGCYRSGLLWALECLAWTPAYFERVVEILARFSAVDIEDNWGNRPDRSLFSIFRSWMPQTSVNIDTRKATLKRLIEKHPAIARQICLAQLAPGRRVGTFSYRPRWRTDSNGFGRPLTRQEDSDFREHVFCMLLNKDSHTQETLGDLLNHLSVFSDTQKTAVWKAVEDWIDIGPPEESKEELRRCIRRNSPLNENPAKRLFEKLEPQDPVLRYTDIFSSGNFLNYIRTSGKTNYQKARAELLERQKQALDEIFKKGGLSSIFRLIERCGNPSDVGRLLKDQITETDLITFVTACLKADEHRKEGLSSLVGLLQACSPDVIMQIDSRVWSFLSTRQQKMDFLLVLPFTSESWKLIDNKDSEFISDYWKQVPPRWNRYSEDEINEIVDRLFKVNRVRAAAHAIRMEWEGLETSRLLSLLQKLPEAEHSENQVYTLDDHDISQMFEELEQRPGVSMEQKTHLEMVYVQSLGRERYGIPNIERSVAANPELYVELIFLLYRSDQEEDKLTNPVEATSSQITAAYRILDALRNIPGQESPNQAESLKAWVDAVRNRCRELNRLDVCDQRIGQLLARSKEDENEIWPSRFVCEVLEEIQSEEIGEGLLIGVINSRGPVCRGVGGTQERVIEEKYRKYASRVSSEFSFVSRMLEQIADYYKRQAKREDLDSKVDSKLRSILE